jgi:hypothetical protein
MRLPSRWTGGLRQQVPASARRSWRRNGCLVRAARGCLGRVVIGLGREIGLLASSRGGTALWTGAVGSGRYRTCASRGFLVGNGPGRECCSIARDGRSGRRVAQMGKSRWSRVVEEGERERAWVMDWDWEELGSAAWDEAGSLRQAEMRGRLSPSSAPKLHYNRLFERHGLTLTRQFPPSASAVRLCGMGASEQSR